MSKYIPAHRRCTRKRHHRWVPDGKFIMDLIPTIKCKFCGKDPN